ncbi:MAG: type 1 glutamine amidotransferase [Mariprofundaceae bacterium]|nr:type 1 glutamine amidotransferase [Mariprofundaceae bacterium]
MRIHVLQHAAFEGPASIATAFAHNPAVTFTFTHLYQGEVLPSSTSDMSLILIMGGPMSVHDEVLYPWLKAEKQWLAQAVNDGCRIVGLCLGAQLIAEVLGGAVTKHTQKEIGWFPVVRMTDESPWTQLLPPSLLAFHWHGETCSLPPDAQPLLRSEACANQAFIWKNQVLALQCHLEMTADSIAALCHHCSDDLVADTWVQQPESMQVSHEQLAVASSLMVGLIHYMLPRPC